MVPHGRLQDLETPYPGGNLFSLASGGAVFIRDPGGKLGEDQLNGGRFGTLSPAHWERILPLLQENERLFGISIDDHLLTVDGAGGGTGMSPWRMMNEWGVPTVYLQSLLYQYLKQLDEKGAYIPCCAMAGFFSVCVTGLSLRILHTRQSAVNVFACIITVCTSLPSAGFT